MWVDKYYICNIVNIPLLSLALITHCNCKSTIHYSYLGCHQVMDCCRKGCPLNKSTNKNANVNIFSHNFFHLERGMKILHYIDSQQREQRTTYTVNEKDDCTMPIFSLVYRKIWELLGVFREQRKTCISPVSEPPLFSFASLKYS